jgi:translation initiation factor IF-2
MNLTELARVLNVNPNFLRDRLPEMGYHIGWRAIKVDNQTAKKIIKEWPLFMKRWQKAEDDKKRAEAVIAETLATHQEVKVPKLLTVRDFAQITGLPINKILAELMKNGIFTSLNEKIDFDTASIIGADLGMEVILDETPEVESSDQSSKIKDVISKEASCDLITRPPVIVVMGHVDHGKTKLLDAIRTTDIVATEAGGITQHIGAYQVKRHNRLLSFIDTPGHEAFTAMRNRGAKVADIAILVVAADDGVKPQTVEAYRIIEAAKIPFIVAINKIDKPEADITRVKQELANQLNVLTEEWGGKVVCVPVSAKEGTGISEILDTLILVADMEEDNLKANPCSQASGTVVESRIDKGEGVVATVLVQNGTLKVGDELCGDGISLGKVRALKNYIGQTIDEAGPSVPARVVGFKIAPTVGDVVQVGAGIRVKNKTFRPQANENVSSITKKEDEKDVAEQINLVIKGDTLGSVEAIEGSLSKIETYGVRIKILSKGLGNITEGDVERAEGEHSLLIGFNVKVSSGAEELARTKNVEIKLYKIIYELLADLKIKIQELVKPEIVRTDLAKLKVLAIFRTEKKEQILGAKVLEGVVAPDSLVEIMRDNELVEQGKITALKIGKEDVVRAETGTECGLKYEGQPVVQIGDFLQVYKEEKVYKKIS